MGLQAKQIYVNLPVRNLNKFGRVLEIVDSTTHVEAIVAKSASSREQVNDIVNKALVAGGKPSNDPIDHGFMYGWSFQDVDGHLWEVMYSEDRAAS